VIAHCLSHTLGDGFAFLHFIFYLLEIIKLKTTAMRTYFIGLCSMLLVAACNTGTKNEAGNSDTSTSAATTNSEESKEERNKQVAMESIKAIINSNADEGLKNAAPDVVDYYDGSGPPMKGLDSVKAGLKMWLNNMKDYKGDNLEAVADGNKVMVYGNWSGTFKGNFMGMKVAGKKFNIKDVDIFTFNDEGKITEHRSVQSMAGLIASTTQGK
jgi:predicted ester cyclase